MPDTTPKVSPPPKTSGGNGQAKKTPSGPSKKTRDNFIKQVKDLIKKKQSGG